MKGTYALARSLDLPFKRLSPFKGLLSGSTRSLVSVAETTLFKVMQLIIDVQFRALLGLTLLIFTPEDLCWSRLLGQKCPDNAPVCMDGLVVDSVLQYVLAVVWFLFCGLPASCFFMPMLFGTRVDSDWRRSKLLKTAYVQRSSTEIAPDAPCACTNYIDDGVYESKKKKKGWDVGVYTYTSTACCWTKRVKVYMTNCWGEETEWLGSFACLLKGLTYGIGIFADVLKTIVLNTASLAAMKKQFLGDSSSAGKKCCRLFCNLCCFPCAAVALVLTYVYDVLFIFEFYMRVILCSARNNFRRLILMTTSVYTEEVMKKHELLERASKNTLLDSDKSHHEQVTYLSAKLHGLFWLFVPGASILSKMAEYLNEDPVIYLLGDGYREVETRTELPKVDFKVLLVTKEGDGKSTFSIEQASNRAQNAEGVVLHMRTTWRKSHVAAYRKQDGDLESDMWPSTSTQGLQVGDRLIIIRGFKRKAKDGTSIQFYRAATVLKEEHGDKDNVEGTAIAAAEAAAKAKEAAAAAGPSDITVEVPQQQGMVRDSASLPIAMPVRPSQRDVGLHYLPGMTRPAEAVSVGQPRMLRVEVPRGVGVGGTFRWQMPDGATALLTCPDPYPENGIIFVHWIFAASSPPSPPPSPPAVIVHSSQLASPREDKSAVKLELGEPCDVVIETGPARSKQGESKDTKHSPKLTVRVFGDGRMLIINDRWFYRDSRSRKTVCGHNPGLITQKLRWIGSIWKFFIFFLGTVTLLRYNESIAACQGILAMAIIPIALKNFITEVQSFIGTMLAYYDLMRLLIELAKKQGKHGHELLHAARQVKKMVAKGAPCGFMRLDEVVRCLNTSDPAVAVERLQELAQQKYHCDLSDDSGLLTSTLEHFKQARMQEFRKWKWSLSTNRIKLSETTLTGAPVTPSDPPLEKVEEADEEAQEGLENQAPDVVFDATEGARVMKAAVADDPAEHTHEAEAEAEADATEGVEADSDAEKEATAAAEEKPERPFASTAPRQIQIKFTKPAGEPFGVGLMAKVSSPPHVPSAPPPSTC